MLYQNIKFALRYIVRNKTYSVLNLTGLVLGLALSIIVYLIIYQEFSYDRFHKNIRQIYQVLEYEKKETGSSILWEISNEKADILSQKVPEFIAISKIPSMPAPALMIDGQSLNDAGIYADHNLFKVFSFELIKGNVENVLGSVNNIVISESLASKYFPGNDPIGKVISTQGKSQQFFTVTGIMKDVPVRSTIQFDYIIPIENFISKNLSWKNNGSNDLLRFYVMLNSKSLPSAVNQKIGSMVPGIEPKEKTELFMFPFIKMHIMPVRYKDASGGGMTGAIIVLSILGFLILFIACVNYMNLATALSLKRTKDTGVKKIFGSTRLKLSSQFLLESFIISLIAMILSLIAAKLIVPWFNQTFNWNLKVQFSDPIMITGLVIILIITTLLSGTYPAFYLSRLNPLKILKGSDAKGRKNTGLRKVLVIIQFFFAILLIIISITCIKQINYIKSKDLGVKIDNMIMFGLNRNLLRYSQPLKDEISKLSSVENVSFTSQNPLFIWSETTVIDYEGKKAEDLVAFSFIETDFDFVKTLGLKIIEGRDFDRSIYTDSLNFIINEKAAKALGSKGAVGSRINFAKKEGTIIGITNDYHMTHMNFQIKPLIIVCNKNSYTSAMVKFREEMTESGTAEVRNIIEKFDKDPELRIIEMRDAFENIYKENVFRIGKLSIIFSLLAIWIACLGLISISMFNAELRTKEIGIHKVHGADVLNIILKMTHEYIEWVLISLVFAIPAGYMVVNKLFSRTAYHTKLLFWIFVFAGIIVLVITLLTVSWQAVRLASKNPAETLKYE
jgi:putative ABC transport system permease protein